MTTAVETPQVPATRPLPQRRTPCLARLSAARQWQQTMGFRLGGWNIGVRANSTVASGRVEERLAAFRVPELDGELAPNFSVELAGEDGGPTRGLHLVYRDHEIVARRRDPEELLDDLVAVVEETRAVHCADLLAARAAAVELTDHTVLLLPAHWHRALLPQQARMAREGLVLLPRRTQLVDVQAADVVTRTLQADGEVRRPIRRCVWLLPEDVHRPVRAAEAVQLGFFAVVNRDVVGPGRALAALAGLVGKVPSVGMADRGGAELVSALQNLARTD